MSAQVIDLAERRGDRTIWLLILAQVGVPPVNHFQCGILAGLLAAWECFDPRRAHSQDRTIQLARRYSKGLHWLEEQASPDGAA